MAANPNLATRRDDDDRLPIHWAVSYNRIPIVSQLIQTKNFDDGSGWTPLMMAASLKDADELVDLLLSRDADVNMKNNNGQTALHFTASKNNLDTARKLVAKKASARVKDKRGQLALHRAAAVGSVPMIKLLLQANSPLNATDMDGMTALHHTIAEGHGDAALVLLKAGADTEKKSIDGSLAIELAPDTKVKIDLLAQIRASVLTMQIMNYIIQNAELEGIELTAPRP
ncbi:putative proteasome regulatory particle subunit protein [Lasiodiplodia theobromae]|nr:putative proteasome regulatory particle subunit protein [Lasiodiplodia theobromae]